MRFAIALVFLSFGILSRNSVTAQCAKFSSFDIALELNEASSEALHSLEDISIPFNLKQALKQKGIALIALGLNELDERKENTRLVASILTLTLGPFGAHRLYLGTDALVPVFYTLTLGGGLGILPVIDLFHILLAKDLSGFYNNPGVFMWGDSEVQE